MTVLLVHLCKAKSFSNSGHRMANLPEPNTTQWSDKRLKKASKIRRANRAEVTGHVNPQAFDLVVSRDRPEVSEVV